MSDEAWQRQRKIYAMLERAAGAGVSAFEHPTLATSLHKAWLADGVRVVRYWNHDHRGYTYVLEKFDDKRYQSWQTADGDASGAGTASRSKTSLPNSSTSPSCATTSESTDSPS